MGKGQHSGKGSQKRGIFLRGFMAAFLLGGIALAALLILVSLSPATGTVGADLLRSVLGPQPVAEIEAVVFTVQDTIHHTLFVLEGSVPAAPWQVSTPIEATQKAAQLEVEKSTASFSPNSNTTRDKNALNAVDKATPTPTQTTWLPANLTPLGSMPDEGVWQAFILGGSGNPVAYRTFLQPDPSRPYVTVAIVALDLTQVLLHYQLGTQEPVSPGRAPGTGQIPSKYQQQNVLLAAFNGGFKTIHGNYGVMVGGKTLVPMIDGMGTLVIYQDGRLRIGEWNIDLTETPGIAVARQNCPLMVRQGEINPLVNNNSVNTWGGTISGNIVTFRSGIGLSQDGKTLYYFAGNYLSMPVLATAMRAAGAYQAMQLDINNYYVLFTSFREQDGHLTGMPLLPKEMVDNINRYLDGFSHDFFFVTDKP